MRSIGLLLAVLVGLSGQTPAPASTTAPKVVRHLVYQFGYNTPAASSGAGTGTTTIDVYAPAADGSVTITGTDFWWNTARPRAANSCTVHPGGAVSCSQRPYAISPMQLTIFPLLSPGFFKGLTAGSTSTWKHAYTVYAAILPGGATGFAGDPYSWKCAFTLTGKGPIANSKPELDLIQTTGTLDQQGGRYWNATSKQKIAFDPVAHLPAVVSDVRTHFPMRTVYNYDTIEMKLIKVSPPAH